MGEVTDDNQTALESIFNGSLTGKREQRIYTPESICNRLRRMWPEGVALDPCHGPGSLVGAEVVAWPENPDGPIDGLAIDWPERTFVNPPYDCLKEWILKASTHRGVVMLCPVRTHRKWFQQALKASAASVWLDPVTFCGYDATFPAPLMLIYWGWTAESWRFCDEFEDMGLPHLGAIGFETSKQREMF